MEVIQFPLLFVSSGFFFPFPWCNVEARKKRVGILSKKKQNKQKSMYWKKPNIYLVDKCLCVPNLCRRVVWSTSNLRMRNDLNLENWSQSTRQLNISIQVTSAQLVKTKQFFLKKTLAQTKNKLICPYKIYCSALISTKKIK